MRALRALVAVLDVREPGAAGHAERVADLSVRVGQAMGIAKAEAGFLWWAGYAHDVGKIGLSDHLLTKEGRYTQAERHAMQRHPLMGGEVLRAVGDVPDVVVEVAESHHERWDGLGYPNAVAGANVSLFVRVVAVADVFDALVHERTYKKAWSVGKAVAWIMEGGGCQFDPRVVDAFVDVVGTRDIQAA